MENDKYLNDIQQIKEMMSKSTQYISLSGMAGIMAGIYAIIGAIVVDYLIGQHQYKYITIESITFKKIIGIAIIVLLLSIGTAFILTLKKAKNQHENIWNATSKRLLINFLIPLITGGILVILLLKNKHYGLIVPMTLIFYGLSCVNASKYTLRDIRYLGITEIILGLIAIELSGYGLWFWVLGFGFCHIIYGSLMYFKYEKK
jgi:hypothetical protein